MLRTMFFAALVAAPAIAHAAPVQVCEAVWSDPARGNRQVPVRIRMPEGAGKRPVILFSHGLGGSLDAGADWVDAWSQAGFITVNIQHAGSDATLWRGSPHPLQSLRGAMNVEQLQARADDVHFVLDRIAAGTRVGACDLGHADMSRVGMSGHSFGAQTTLAIAGARYSGVASLADRRVTAAIAFSPQPSIGQSDAAAFGGISMPFMTVTGTADQLPFLNQVTPEDRQRPYRAMPSGGKYLLVLDGANHGQFSGQDLPDARARPTPHIREVTVAATTDFWRATLTGDAAATRRLAGPGGLHTMLTGADWFAAK